MNQSPNTNKNDAEKIPIDCRGSGSYVNYYVFIQCLFGCPAHENKGGDDIVLGDWLHDENARPFYRFAKEYMV